jgi:DNA-binding NtrC family response regulator
VQTGVNAPVVLVVDDEPAMRLLCRVNLELDGFRVVEAATLAGARAVLELEPVGLVLLDLHVGLERGETLLDEIRGREPRIPVVVVTGSADVDSGELRVDADAVLAKPFTVEELTRAVQRLVPTPAELRI